ncbi:MAG TPA: peptidoglycan-binding protein [Alphaproteobacteria bacterium]|nr:peptidoglycan-binding protein [Alphaproteobacteria bacterium]
MGSLEKATIEILGGRLMGGAPITVMFNPSDYTRERSNSYKAIAVPGLGSPLLQFVSGDADQLSMELFLDDYSDPAGDLQRGPKKSVAQRVREISSLLEIDRDLHAPPPVRFIWGTLRFEAVIEKLSQKFTLFRPDGTPARATLSVTFKEYVSIARQLIEPRRESADKSKRRQIEVGNSLWLVAAREFGLPSAWRTIAIANDIDNPWQLTPGDWIDVPPLEGADGPRRPF